MDKEDKGKLDELTYAELQDKLLSNAELREYHLNSLLTLEAEKADIKAEVNKRTNNNPQRLE